MRNDFASAAAALSIEFRYAREDYMNLEKDVDANKVYLFVDPPRITPAKSQNTGAEFSETAEGRFMLLEKSSLDEKYDETQNAAGVTTDTKYQAHIEPLITVMKNLIKSLENCGAGWAFSYSYTELINVFSENMDGVLVNYKATRIL